ncbi:MAG: terminase small subunit [Rhodocyclaceae bacterium]|nr:terminase small subunit [Rhodocyclaceae bacterium]
MGARPKLTKVQWRDARKHWETDPREGYLWLVTELDLPVSAPAVRKAALRERWVKKAPLAFPGEAEAETIETKKPSNPANTKEKKERTKVSKVSKNKETKKRETEEPLDGVTLTQAERVERDPDKFGVFDDLSDIQEMFVREYLRDLNGTKAAIRAGYSPKSAAQAAWALLRNPSVTQAIEVLGTARARRIGIDSDEMMRMWSAVLCLDANEISQLRRVCCPYCWGEDHQLQYTPGELRSAKIRHEKERARRLRANADDDIGEFPEYTGAWYDKRKPPVDGCPECSGEGVVEVFFCDTRNLSPAAKLVYSGVKAGRDGIEVLMMSKEKAADNLARAMGMFKDQDKEADAAEVASDKLFKIYEENMRKARERQALVLAERQGAE